MIRGGGRAHRRPVFSDDCFAIVLMVVMVVEGDRGVILPPECVDLRRVRTHRIASAACGCGQRHHHIVRGAAAFILAPSSSFAVNGFGGVLLEIVDSLIMMRPRHRPRAEIRGGLYMRQHLFAIVIKRVGVTDPIHARVEGIGMRLPIVVAEPNGRSPSAPFTELGCCWLLVAARGSS